MISQIDSGQARCRSGSGSRRAPGAGRRSGPCAGRRRWCGSGRAPGPCGRSRSAARVSSIAAALRRRGSATSQRLHLLRGRLGQRQRRRGVRGRAGAATVPVRQVQVGGAESAGRGAAGPASDGLRRSRRSRRARRRAPTAVPGDRGRAARRATSRAAFSLTSGSGSTCDDLLEQRPRPAGPRSARRRRGSRGAGPCWRVACL